VGLNKDLGSLIFKKVYVFSNHIFTFLRDHDQFSNRLSLFREKMAVVALV
jgi:hypothetical protein